MNISIYHNILWSKYKGAVFGEIFKKSSPFLSFSFVQIAETDSERLGLSEIDLSYHKYPYKLLFKTQYGRINKMQLIFALIKDIQTRDSQLILLPGYHMIEYWAMLFACILFRKKRAVFCDSTIYDRPKSLIKLAAKKIFFGLCNGYFGYGQRSRDYMLTLGAKADRIFYRCQAAAMPHNYSTETAFSSRIKKAASKTHPHFLYVGRLSHEKGLDTLFKAFSHVLSVYPNATLSLIGSGPLLEALVSLAVDLKVDKNTFFKGSKSIDEIATEYVSATCLVLPSRSEPWGLVVNEALSYGCPVIVSHVCGCVPELVKDGITGYSFKMDDEQELARHMVRIVSDSSDAELIARQCIDLISNYSPQNAADQIIRGCRSILRLSDHA